VLREDKVQRDMLEQQDLKVLKVEYDQQDSNVTLVPQVHRVARVRWVQQDLLELKDHKVHKVELDLRVLKVI
jgi:hypothetical protein